MEQLYNAWEYNWLFTHLALKWDWGAPDSFWSDVALCSRSLLIASTWRDSDFGVYHSQLTSFVPELSLSQAVLPAPIIKVIYQNGITKLLIDEYQGLPVKTIEKIHTFIIVSVQWKCKRSALLVLSTCTSVYSLQSQWALTMVSESYGIPLCVVDNGVPPLPQT